MQWDLDNMLILNGGPDFIELLFKSSLGTAITLEHE